MAEDWDGKERRQNFVKHELQVFHAILGVAALLIAQTAGIVWWAATTSERVNSVITKVAELEKLTTDRYRATDAAKDFIIRDQRIARNEKDIQTMLEIVTGIDRKVDKLLNIG